MSDLFLALIFVGIFLFALAGVLSLAGVLHFTSKREDGWLHLGIYGTLFATGIMILTSGRNIAFGMDAGVAAAGGGHSPIAAWVIRLTSMGFVLLAAERVASAVLQGTRGRMLPRPPALLPAFLVFWLGTFLSPALLGANPHFDHEGLYTVIIGAAFILCSLHDSERAVLSARNAIGLFNLAGFVTALVRPELVLDFNYLQGVVPGMPRFTGLTPHALSLGIVVQLGIYCLWVKPYRHRMVNVVAWILLLASLVLAQSKTAWVSFMVCALIMAVTQYRALLSRYLLDATRPWPGVIAVGLVIASVGLLALALVFADAGRAIDQFLMTSEGARLASLTGRDLIWEVALREWSNHPVFGYGPPLFDAAYREAVGISSATHAHNQVIDTMARSGVVGLIALLSYVLVLMYWSIRFSAQTGGLTVLLFVALFIRGIGEVPLTMIGYGVEFLGHILLLTAICGAYRRSVMGASSQVGDGAPQAPAMIPAQTAH